MLPFSFFLIDSARPPRLRARRSCRCYERLGLVRAPTRDLGLLRRRIAGAGATAGTTGSSTVATTGAATRTRPGSGAARVGARRRRSATGLRARSAFRRSRLIGRRSIRSRGPARLRACGPARTTRLMRTGADGKRERGDAQQQQAAIHRITSQRKFPDEGAASQAAFHLRPGEPSHGTAPERRADRRLFLGRGALLFLDRILGAGLAERAPIDLATAGPHVTFAHLMPLSCCLGKPPRSLRSHRAKASE